MLVSAAVRYERLPSFLDCIVPPTVEKRSAVRNRKLVLLNDFLGAPICLWQWAHFMVQRCENLHSVFPVATFNVVWKGGFLLRNFILQIQWKWVEINSGIWQNNSIFLFPTHKICSSVMLCYICKLHIVCHSNVQKIMFIISCWHVYSFIHWEAKWLCTYVVTLTVIFLSYQH